MEPIGFWMRRSQATSMQLPHSHCDVELNFVHRGFLRYLHGGRIHDLQCKDWVIFWAAFPHQVIASADDTELTWLTFPIADLLRWRIPGQLQDLLLEGETVFDRSVPEGLMTQWLNDYENRNHRIILLELQARLIRLSQCLELAQPRASTPALDQSLQKFEQVTAYLAAHFRDPISADDIAAAVGLHPKYLSSMFKRISRIGLWDYVLHLRIAEAQRLLLQTDMKVMDIAFESGFNNPSTFYHAFRKMTGGVSPRQFRLEMRGS